MSIHLDKEKKTYTVRWRETNKTTGEIVHRSKRGFVTKREARAFEDEVLNIKSYASFKQLLDMYVDSLKGYTLEETRNDKLSLADRYLDSLFSLNVRNIKKSDIIALKNKIADLDRSIVVKNKILRLVKSVSKFGAEVYDYPDFAKFLKVFPKTSNDVKEMMIISPSDFNLAMEQVSNEVYKRFLTFLYHTGMRRGEAMALKKSNISIIDGRYYARIENSVRRNDLKSLKNPHSKRTILLDNVSCEAIKPLLELEGDYIFGENEPLSGTTISRQFDNALSKVGLPHYRVHDLRHSFVSNAILNGIDIVSVSKYVGHANIERTLNTYSHLLKDSELRMIDRLNELHKDE